MSKAPRYVPQSMFAVLVLAAALVTGCSGGGSSSFSPSGLQNAAVAKRAISSLASPTPLATTSGTSGPLQYRISGTPKLGAGGLLWADVVITDPEPSQPPRASAAGRNQPQALARKVAPTSYTVHVPIVDGKPELPINATKAIFGHEAQPLDHAISGCGTAPYVVVTPGAQVNTDWYFPEVLVGQNGQPYSGNITWAQGTTFTVPITGSVAFDPAQTPNDAKTVTDETFSIPQNIVPNLYQYSATGVLGDGTQEGTGILTLLAYYPVIDPVNTSTTYVLVKPGGSASYTFSDQTDARDGAAQWVVWSALPSNSTSSWLNATTSSPPHANTLTISTSASTPTGEYAVGILIQYAAPLCRQSEGNAANVLIDVETPSPSPSPTPKPTAGPSSSPSAGASASPSPSPLPSSTGCGGGFLRRKSGFSLRPAASCTAIPVTPYIEVSAIVTRSGPGTASSPTAIQTAPSTFQFNLGPSSPQVSFTGPVHIKLDIPSPGPTASSPWTLKLDRINRSSESSQTTRQTSIPLANRTGSYDVHFACLNLPLGAYATAEGYWLVNGTKYSDIVGLTKLPSPHPPIVIPSSALLSSLESQATNTKGALLVKLPYVLAAANMMGVHDLNYIADILAQIDTETSWNDGTEGTPDKVKDAQTYFNAKYGGKNYCAHSPNDGSEYIGRGLVMITGRCLYYYYTHDPVTNPTKINLMSPYQSNLLGTSTAAMQLDASIAVDVVLTARNRDCQDPAPYDDTNAPTCVPRPGAGLSSFFGTLQPDGGEDEVIPSGADITNSRTIVLGASLDGSEVRLYNEFLKFRGVDDGC